MGTVIHIIDAVFPRPADLMVEFADEASKRKFIEEGSFEFQVNGKIYAKGTAKDYLSDSPPLEVDEIYRNTGKHRVFLDIFDPPGLREARKREYEQGIRSIQYRMPAPGPRDRNKVVIIVHDQRIERYTSGFTKGEREMHGLPDPNDET